MTARTRAVLAWSVAAACFGFVVVGAVASARAAFEWGGVGFALGMAAAPVIGALIVSRSPNVVGWLLLVVGVGGTLAIALGSLAEPTFDFPGQVWVAWVGNWVWPPSMGSLLLILQLFPDGRPLTRLWRWLVWLTAIAVLALVVGGAFAPGPLGDYEHFVNPVGIEALDGPPLGSEENIGWGLVIVAVVGSAASLVVRYRRSRGERRQQLKWLAYAAAVFAAGWIAITATWDSPAFALIGEVVFGAGIIALPVAIGIAILRYRLYDIDVVINKTLVYGALAAFVTGVYVAIVVGVGTAIGTRGRPNLALQVGATALVAFAFGPVRERVQRVANRVVYGQRATPYEVVSEVSSKMSSAVGVEELLPEMAEAAARGVGAERAAVRVELPGGESRTVEWPGAMADGSYDRTFEVRHGGERVGEIAVAKRRGDPVRPGEERLLSDLASQAGLAFHNVRLTEELRARLAAIARQAEALRASRARLVTARDEERRSLERQISLGVERDLERIASRLSEVEWRLGSDPEGAAATLAELGDDANRTLETLRDLARGIFPPLLADKGIVAALRAQVVKLGSELSLRAEDAIAALRFEPDVEARVYFCVVEAVRNASAPVTVQLSERDGAIAFEIASSASAALDFDDEQLQRIRDRVEALGGTLVAERDGVAGRIPARVMEEVS